MEFPITIKKSKRARHVRVTVNCDASVVVTTPFYFSKSATLRFVNEKMRWIVDKVNYFKRLGNRTVLPRGRRAFTEHKEQARALVMNKIAEINKNYNFIFNKITIRNSLNRWGSCSRKRNLNFSYRLAFLPQHLVDYIVAHELCHLAEFNHSKTFKGLVERVIPDRKERIKELKMWV